MKITLIIIDEHTLRNNPTINIPGTRYIGVNWEDESVKYLNSNDMIHVRNSKLSAGGVTLRVQHKGHRFEEGLFIYCHCPPESYIEMLSVFNETDEQGDTIPSRS
jgi:hypothetical protein